MTALAFLELYGMRIQFVFNGVRDHRRVYSVNLYSNWIDYAHDHTLLGSFSNYSPGHHITSIMGSGVNPKVDELMALDILEYIQAYHERTDAWENHEIELADKFYDALSVEGKDDFDNGLWQLGDDDE